MRQKIGWVYRVLDPQAKALKLWEPLKPHGRGYTRDTRRNKKHRRGAAVQVVQIGEPSPQEVFLAPQGFFLPTSPFVWVQPVLGLPRCLLG